MSRELAMIQSDYRLSAERIYLSAIVYNNIYLCRLPSEFP